MATAYDYEKFERDDETKLKTFDSNNVRLFGKKTTKTWIAHVKYGCADSNVLHMESNHSLIIQQIDFVERKAGRHRKRENTREVGTRESTHLKEPLCRRARGESAKRIRTKWLPR